MIYLLLVSLIWAFSFGLIKTNLTTVHPIVVTGLRLFIASLVFLPFLKLRKIQKKTAIALFIIGGIEFGLMYIFYNFSFQYLKAFEVALFTIFTPLYVTVVSNIVERKWNNPYILTSIMAIIGTAIIVHTGFTRPGMVLGFIFVQLSNLCFAIGQVYYRRTMRNFDNISDAEIFAIPYLGGFAAALIASIFFVRWNEIQITNTQWLNLLYLGALASGIGFFLWNYGARRTNIGALAIFNNLKIPLSITVSLLFFHEKTDIPGLLLGGTIVIASLVINQVIEGKRKTVQTTE